MSIGSWLVAVTLFNSWFRQQPLSESLVFGLDITFHPHMKDVFTVKTNVAVFHKVHLPEYNGCADDQKYRKRELNNYEDFSEKSCAATTLKLSL